VIYEKPFRFYNSTRCNGLIQSMVAMDITESTLLLAICIINAAKGNITSGLWNSFSPYKASP
jgi:hypothetical protein